MFPRQPLDFFQLPPFEIDEPYEWVSADECPNEIQLWIVAYKMAKRLGGKIPPFPTRYVSRYFGPCDINAANGWGIVGDLDTILRGCVPPSEETTPASVLDLLWEDGSPAFPLPKPEL